MKKFLIFILALVAFEYFLSSCAGIASPGGGPRDTTVPELDTSYPPNFSLNFNSKEITLIFNEYITLKNANQQIMLSPLTDEKLEIKSRAKVVTIELPDTLLENTTYTLSFGSSITDFTEGNVNDKFKYIFSTGDFIDSLLLSGNITDAFTNEPVKEMLVALYELEQTDSLNLDSLPYKRIPTYYTYTDELGYFKLEYLKYGRFMFLAFNDKRGNFKLNTGNEEMAIYTELINMTDSIEPLRLKSFKPLANRRFYGARLKEKGKVQLSFSQPVPDIEVERIFPTREVNRDSVFIELNENKDTLFYWFEDNGLDSIKLKVSGYENIDDTNLVRIIDYESPELSLDVADTEIKSGESIKINANLPVTKIDSSKIYLYDSQDTIPFSVEFKARPAKEFLIKPAAYPSNMSLSLLEGAVKGFFNTESDSLKSSLRTLKGEDLGNLKFIVVADSVQDYVLIMTNPTGKEVVNESFRGYLTIDLKRKKPGEYKAYIIKDRNRDGKWTPGSFIDKRLPESVIYYQDKIEIRANWDIELEWKVKEP